MIFWCQHWIEDFHENEAILPFFFKFKTQRTTFDVSKHISKVNGCREYSRFVVEKSACRWSQVYIWLRMIALKMCLILGFLFLKNAHEYFNQSHLLTYIITSNHQTINISTNNPHRNTNHHTHWSPKRLTKVGKEVCTQLDLAAHRPHIPSACEYQQICSDHRIGTNQEHSFLKVRLIPVNDKLDN